MTTSSNKIGIRTRSQESVLFSREHTTLLSGTLGGFDKKWPKRMPNHRKRVVQCLTAASSPLYNRKLLCWAEASYYTRNKQKRERRVRIDLLVTQKIFHLNKKETNFHIYPSTQSCVYIMKKIQDTVS